MTANKQGYGRMEKGRKNEEQKREMWEGWRVMLKSVVSVWNFSRLGMKIGVILQSQFSNFNFLAVFWKKSEIFRWEKLPMSEKSSTFACFFAARVRGRPTRGGIWGGIWGEIERKEEGRKDGKVRMGNEITNKFKLT